MHGWHSQPDIYVIFNAHWEWQKFFLPPRSGQWRWRRLVDTRLDPPEDISEDQDAIPLDPADHYNAGPRSVVILISQF
jgi:pullulanase/glycogen debranching enzyme